MVKGVNRRVIVVKEPAQKYFEQAIFIVKEDIFENQGITEQHVLAEAQRVANGYIKTQMKPHWYTQLPRWACGVIGAVVSSGIWGASLFFLL